jgi:hypothetical protein
VPTVVFAVHVADALPLGSVVTVVLARVQLAPVPLGAVKVTATPLTGFDLVSRTVAFRGANAVPTVALCGVPPVAEIEAGVGFELEPQLVTKPKDRQTNVVRILA